MLITILTSKQYLQFEDIRRATNSIEKQTTWVKIKYIGNNAEVSGVNHKTL